MYIKDPVYVRWTYYRKSWKKEVQALLIDYIPLQFEAGVYPAFSASSFVANQILFSSLICFALPHHGRWYLVPLFEATYPFWDSL